MDVCNKILDEKGRKNLDTWHETKSKTRSKSFFFNILEEKDLYNYPQIMDFILGDDVVQILLPYYKMLPRLCSVGLYYSPISISNQRSSSQNFHLDGTDPSHVKCFINISDVGANDGPFTFISANRSNELRLHNGGLLRSAGLEDRALLSRYEKEFGISLTGKPGSGAFVDTSRCLHYGSVCEENPRVVFMFHYAVFANYTELEINPLRDLRMQHHPRLRERFGVDELRRNLLRID